MLKLTQKVNYEEIKANVLKFCEVPKTSKEIMKYTGIRTRSVLSRRVIQPLMSMGKLNYTNTNSMYAKNQKYVTLNKNENAILIEKN